MSILNEHNFSMSAERYLAKHHIVTYLEDSISQLLECKEDNPKVVPAKFLSDYFCSLRDGQHTMFREFAYIKSTPHNRMSFVVLFWKCFQQIGKKGDLLSIQEYHSLLGLLCPDFPFQLVQNIARIILIDDALDCLISFSDFMYAFQVQFYFEEFLGKAYKIYQGLLQNVSSPREPVIVPTSGENDATVHQNTHQPSDGVDAMQFFRALYPLINKVDYRTPPLDFLKEVLYNVQHISFYEFLMAISKSDSINTFIGCLPGKTELLESDNIEQIIREINRNQEKQMRTQYLGSDHIQITKNGLTSGRYGTFKEEEEVNRMHQKVEGNTSQNKLSSVLPWTSASTDGMLSAPVSNTGKVHSGHQKLRPVRKACSPDIDTETDSGSSTDSSESN